MKRQKTVFSKSNLYKGFIDRSLKQGRTSGNVMYIEHNEETGATSLWYKYSLVAAWYGSTLFIENSAFGRYVRRAKWDITHAAQAAQVKYNCINNIEVDPQVLLTAKRDEIYAKATTLAKAAVQDMSYWNINTYKIHLTSAVTVFNSVAKALGEQLVNDVTFNGETVQIGSA